jgi:hypothetical protein
MNDPIEGIGRIDKETVDRANGAVQVGGKTVRNNSFGGVSIGDEHLNVIRNPRTHRIVHIPNKRLFDLSGRPIDWVSEDELGTYHEPPEMNGSLDSDSAGTPTRGSPGATFNPLLVIPIAILAIFVGVVTGVTVVGSLGWLALLTAIIWKVAVSVAASRARRRL